MPSKKLRNELDGVEVCGELEGQAVLVTGGGRGIGKAIALAFAARGARLTLASRTDSELQETSQEITTKSATEVHTVVADVSSRNEIRSMVESSLETYGSIDVLVNNAGNLGPVGRLWNNDPDAWERTIAVHLFGTFYGCRAVLPHMLERGTGRIVNLAGVGSPNLTAYDAAKSAIVNLTENLALELANTAITVNAMSPGSIHTRMWEENRDQALTIGDDVMYHQGVNVTSGGGASIDRAAQLAVFLGSDLCGRLSGRLLHAVSDRFEEFPSHVDRIMSSRAGLMRRVELDEILF